MNDSDREKNREQVKHDAANYIDLSRELIDDHAPRVFRINKGKEKDIIELTQADAEGLATVIAAYVLAQRPDSGKPVHIPPEVFADKLSVSKKVAFTAVFILQGKNPGLFAPIREGGENRFLVNIEKIEAEAQRAAEKAAGQNSLFRTKQ